MIVVILEEGLKEALKTEGVLLGPVLPEVGLHVKQEL